MSVSVRVGLRGRLLHGTALAGLIASGVVGLATAVNAQAILPEGGVVTAGSATISSPGANSLLIEQASPTAIIEWQGFSVGGNATAHFDNGSGATLNRVVGNNPSEIHGTLSATGSLYVVNQAGVTVGPGGRVLTGGSFVASTHDVLDIDFLAGGDLVLSGSSKAQIVNHGIIRSAMGDVALIARRVENTGEIEALNGTAGLIAGYEVLMREASGADGKFAVRIGGSDTEVVNSGTIRAAEVELRANGGNVYALGINTKGVIKATGATKKSGRIFLTAEGGRIEVGGTVKAERRVVRRTTQVVAQPKARGGEVFVNADAIRISGHIDVSAAGGGKGGRIEAIATGSMLVTDTARFDASGSTGGFVETSGAAVAIEAGARVNTLGASGGAGTWLIDPTDFTIAAGAAGQTASGIGADTLMANLETTNVELQTVAAGVGEGDIFINAAVSWNAATTLKLTAHDDVFINAAITGRRGGLTINAAGEINTAAAGSVDVGTFILERGDWVQKATTLPAFNARDFRLEGGSFLRVTGGDGSAATPYLVADVFGLQGIGSRAAYRAANWKLTADIDAGGTANWNGGLGWKPIGTETGANEYFTGSFDGGGHMITGLTIIRPDAAYIGLFGVMSNATAKDLQIADANILGRHAVGAFAGYAQARDGISLVRNVKVDGKVSGISSIGGLIGQQSVTTGMAAIENANSDVRVTGTYGVGGLVGTNSALGYYGASSAIVRDASSSGVVYGLEGVGGLVGNQSSSFNGLAQIENSLSRSSVSGRDRVGGLVGSNNGDTGQAIVRSSSASGSVNATGDDAGGLVGRNDGQSAIYSSRASGNVVGRNNVGGLVGLHRSLAPTGAAIISRSSATGSASGNDNVGGLVGQSYTSHGRSTTIELSYVSGAVQGSSAAGGLVGLSGSYNYGYNYLLSSGWDVGGTGQNSAVGAGVWSYSTSIGLTGAENYQQSSYEALGWNFSSAGDWFIIDGATRPFLRSEYSTTITNARQLQLMAMDLSASYTLANDIDFAAAFATGMWSAKGFAPIGIDAAGNPLGGLNELGGFRGSLNGAGHEISGLVIDRTGPRSGLFGHVGGSGAISQIGLNGGSIKGSSFTGGMAGVLFGTITEGWTVGTAVTGTSNVGGLVGYAGATVNTMPEIYRSSSSGTVTATATGSAGNAGGLVGRLAGGLVVRSSSLAIVTSNRDAVGGLVGWVSNNGGVVGSYSNGSATGRSGVGGLVGKVDAGSALYAVYSYADATGLAISGGSGPVGVDVGGLVGNNAGTITQAWTSGRVIGAAGLVTLGGLVGKNTGSVQLSYFDTQTSGRTVGIGINDGTGSAAGRTTAQLMDPTNYAGWIINQGPGSEPVSEGWWQVPGETRPFLVSEYTYDIRNAHQLQLMAMDLTASYTLRGNVDASRTDGAASPSGMWSSRGFVPVGDSRTANQFGGSLDGRLHEIWGLTINRPDTAYVGLFGAALNATISNVGIKNARVAGHHYVGMLAGLMLSRTDASVGNAWSSGEVSGRQFVGGLIGMTAAENGGRMSAANVRSSANVSGTSGEVSFTEPNQYLGGLFGVNFANVDGEATVRNAVATGNVTGSASASLNWYMGGLTGGNVAATGGHASIEIAYATGSVTGNAANNQAIGGFIGVNGSQGGQAFIGDAYATGHVGVSGDVNSHVGGFAGYNIDLGDGTANITRTLAAGTVTASGSQNNAIGSLVGLNEGMSASGSASVTASFWRSDASLAGIGSETGGATNGNNAGLTVAALQDTDGFMALAGAQGWNFRQVWAPSTAGYYADLYAVSPVVRVDIGSLTRQYGDPNPDLGFARQYGGPSDYVFGWANDSLPLFGQPSTTATITSNVGSYGVDLPALVTSKAGQIYRVVSTGKMQITPRDLQIEGYREYNGSVAIDASQFYLWNVVNNDVVNVTGVGFAIGADAGTFDYLASLGTLAIDNPNYRIREDWAYYHFDQRQIVLGGTRAYDGTTHVDVADLVVTNLVAGDTVNLSGSGVTIASGDAGQQTINGFSVNVDNPNYAVWNATGSVWITPRSLTITADDKSKPRFAIDPALTWQVTGGIGFVGADNASSTIAGSLQRAPGENAGNYAIGQGTLAATSGNYTIAFVGGVMTIQPVAAAPIISPTATLQTGTRSGVYEEAGNFGSVLGVTGSGATATEECKQGVLGPECQNLPHPDNRQIGHLSFVTD